MADILLPAYQYRSVSCAACRPVGRPSIGRVGGVPPGESSRNSERGVPPSLSVQGQRQPRSRSSPTRTSVLVVAFVLAAGAAGAQEQTGTLQGRLVDTSGAALPG